MKITQFDPDHSRQLGSGDTFLVTSTGSNAGFGGDVVGSWGDLSVVGLRSTVSLSSNLSGAIGDVLTIISTSPLVAQFANSSNTSITSNFLLRTKGGAGQVTTISSAGTAQTLMVGGANYFDVTLNANCTIGFTGWPPTGSIAEIGVRITEDGTGGWTPTFSGVTWVGGSPPTHTTTASTSTEYVFWTDDGGVTVIGGQISAGGGGGSVSFGSNAVSVSAANNGGASTNSAREDHRHFGIQSITSSSSNTMDHPIVNFRAGTGIAITATDTDGNGNFDTATIGMASPGGNTVALIWVVDGGGSAMTTGVKGDLQVPFACTITRWSVLLDQSGSIVFDVWKDTEANYPPTVADTITASAKPTVSSAQKASGAPTGWTTAVAAGDTFRFNVDSITSATRAVLTLTATRA